MKGSVGRRPRVHANSGVLSAASLTLAILFGAASVVTIAARL